MPGDYDQANARRYAQREASGSDYLAFRDLPELLQRYVINGPALDLGCGTGRAGRLLQALGFDCCGADVSAAMLSEARERDPSGSYHLIGDAQLPFAAASFALVLSSFVLLEIASRDELRQFLREVARVMRPGAHAIFMTTTTEFYSGNWVSCDVNFPENQGTLQSGQQVKVRLLPENIELRDFYWSDDDYRDLFQQAGLGMLQQHRPLGLHRDPIAWKDELTTAPFVVYVLTKR